MTGKHWLAVSAVVVVGLAVVLVSWNHRSRRPDEGAARAQELNELEAKMARLQGKMAALEARASAPAPAQPGAAGAATDQPAPAQNQNLPPRRPPTQEEQTARFEGYFDSLDALRGKREDGPLTKQFADSLAAMKSEFKSLHGAKVDTVSCGNGLCRLELTFASSADLATGKGELLFQIGPLAGATTMYADPERNQLFAYFSARGTELPPFPHD